MADTEIMRKIEVLQQQLTSLQIKGAGESNQQKQRIETGLDDLRAALEGLRTEIEQQRPVSKDIQPQIMRAKQEWEATADSLSELVCLVNDQGHIMRANRTLESWNLGDVTEVRGRALHEVLHPGCTDPDCYLVAFWHQAQTELSRGRTTEHKVDDEVLGRHLRIRARPIRAHAGGKRRQIATFAVVVVYDITAYERAKVELERSRELATLVAAQEKERRRIAHELHDEAGQALTALKISLEMIHEALPAELESLRQQTSDAMKIVDMTTDRIRMLAQGLRPPALDAVGLNLALKDFCQMFARRTRLSITYAGTDLPALSDPKEITLYRFLQEALNNVAKHAQANNVSVELSYNGSTVSLAIEDDGQGFAPPTETSTTSQSPGLGLIGMRERVELLGGNVESWSQAGEGTRLVAHVPVENTRLVAQ